MSDKMLIIDDEAEIADLIEAYLRNGNYEVLKFYSPNDVLTHMGEIQFPDYYADCRGRRIHICFFRVIHLRVIRPCKISNPDSAT